MHQVLSNHACQSVVIGFIACTRRCATKGLEPWSFRSTSRGHLRVQAVLHVDRRHIDKEVELTRASQVRTSRTVTTKYADCSPLLTRTMLGTSYSRMHMPLRLPPLSESMGILLLRRSL